MATLTYGTVDNWIEFFIACQDWLAGHSYDFEDSDARLQALRDFAALAKRMSFSLTVGYRASEFLDMTKHLNPRLYAHRYEYKREDWLDVAPAKVYYVKCHKPNVEGWVYVCSGDSFYYRGFGGSGRHKYTVDNGYYAQERVGQVYSSKTRTEPETIKRLLNESIEGYRDATITTISPE